jgi:hypothetical protein
VNLRRMNFVKHLRWAILLAIAPLSVSAQTPQLPASTTTLTSNSPTLVLPGSLTLTSIVNPTVAAGGVPSGNVNFFYDGIKLPGSAQLKILPSTQTFPNVPSASQSIPNYPSRVVSFKMPATSQSFVGVLSSTLINDSRPYNPPALTIFSGQGSSLLDPSKTKTFQIPKTSLSVGNVDFFSTADFNNDGIPDILVHGGDSFGYEYDVLLGKSDGTFPDTSQIISTDYGHQSCSCSAPSDVLAIDDFNGDGYGDVAYLTNASTGWKLGISLNSGSASPGAFNASSFGYRVDVPVDNSPFCAIALTTGHFTSSGHTDVAILGQYNQNCNNPSSAIAGSILMYLGNGDGTVTGASTPIGISASAIYSGISSADFNKDGNLDVAVVHHPSTYPTPGIGTVEVLFGDGKGNLAGAAAIQVGPSPGKLIIADFNGDGYPDILVVDDFDFTLRLALNDGTGHFPGKVQTIYTAPDTEVIASGDFNSDGLTDIAALVESYYVYPNQLDSYIVAFLNSASAQATFTTAPQTLPAGSHTLTATFPGDSNFAASTSAGLSETVSQTPSTLAWTPPAAIQYGTPLGGTQLNAVASVPGTITYIPVAGTILSPGTTKLTAAFTPTDTFDYTSASASQSITIPTPSLSGIAPATAKLGDPNTTITITGQGLVNGAVARLGQTVLATTFIDLNHLTALVPASLLASVGSSTVTVVDPGNLAVSGSQPFTILAPPPTVTVTSAPTVMPAQPSTITLSIGSYPVDIVATITLSFTPAQANGATDPTVVFINNTVTDTIPITANSTAAIAPISYQTGSTAGTITLTTQLTLAPSAGGTNITPASLTPLVITVPAGPPAISSTTLTRVGTTLQVVTLGLSTTRDMAQASFHFTPASGKSLKTTDLTVQLTTPFATWYQTAGSIAFGTTFSYTQPFTLDSDATDVGSVTVTLSNSQGASQTSTAQ